MREALPLPDKPPYTVHVGNLSFDVTESEITDYFTGCSVTNVRIVEDKLEMKPKGFGYVEFASLDGLKKALDFNGTQFGGRNIRVSVAEPRESSVPTGYTRCGGLSNIADAESHDQPRTVPMLENSAIGLARGPFPICRVVNVAHPTVASRLERWRIRRMPEATEASVVDRNSSRMTTRCATLGIGSAAGLCHP